MPHPQPQQPPEPSRAAERVESRSEVEALRDATAALREATDLFLVKVAKGPGVRN